MPDDEFRKRRIRYQSIPSCINTACSTKSKGIILQPRNSHSPKSTQISLDTVTLDKMRFTTIVSVLSIATGALVTAVPTPGDEANAPASGDVRDIFKIEKRCQSNGQFCDGVGIKCCAGQCCNYRKGVNTYCGNCDQ